MILVFDEDSGTKVPRALRIVGLQNVIPITSKVPKGTKDPVWIPIAGQERWLVFSCNKAMLNVAAERDLIISEKVGIVFLTNGQENRATMLRLVLNRWKWLQKIDELEQRPFAFYLYPNNQTRKRSLSV